MATQLALICKRRPYSTQGQAERALWAMKVNGRVYADKLRVVKCTSCGDFHIQKAR